MKIILVKNTKAFSEFFWSKIIRFFSLEIIDQKILFNVKILKFESNKITLFQVSLERTDNILCFRLNVERCLSMRLNLKKVKTRKNRSNAQHFLQWILKLEVSSFYRLFQAHM